MAYTLCVYTTADNRLVLVEESPILPVMPGHWPHYDDTIHDYIVGVPEGEIDLAYWDETTSSLTSAAAVALGIDSDQKSKYKLGWEFDVQAPDVEVSHFVVTPATGVIVQSAPALSAQQKSLSVSFTPGALDCSMTGGPFGGPVVTASSSISVRVTKQYSDETTAATAADNVTMIPFGAMSGIETLALVSGVKDFTIDLPAVTGYIALIVKSNESDTDYGMFRFYRDAP